jgi:hypothetical protein
VLTASGKQRSANCRKDGGARKLHGSTEPPVQPLKKQSLKLCPETGTADGLACFLPINFT